MIQDLLAILQEESLVSASLLARRLNTSLGLVEMMLVELERAGYLRQVNGDDCGGCAGCGGQPSCRPAQGRIWARTEKLAR